MTDAKVKSTLGGYSSINTYVKGKIEKFSATDKSFSSLFSLMFSEKENAMFESTDGYKIRTVSYGEAEKRVGLYSKKLNHLLRGAEKDCFVGISMRNSEEWIEIFWAVLMSGFKPLLFNTRLSEEILNGICSTYGVLAVISDRTRYCAKTVYPEELLNLPDGESDGKWGSGIIVMSSGTSLNVKLCEYTSEQIWYQINDSAKIITECRRISKHYNGSLKLLTFLPFYHIFGLVAVYIWFAFFSRTFVLLKDLNADTLLNTVRKHKVTHIFSVPLLWNKIYDAAIAKIKAKGDKTYNKFIKGLAISDKIANVPLLGEVFARKAFKEVRDNIFGDSIQFLITGGSAVSREVMRFFNGIGYRLADGYGMTEIGITSVELSDNRKYLNSRSVGRPFSSVEYKINQSGELLVRGKSIASAIMQNGERKRVDNCEWFNTHDFARFEDGRFYIEGRRDDLIVCRSGENLNPELMESFINIDGANGVCITASGSGESISPVLLVSVKKYLPSDRLREIKSQAAEQIKRLKLDGDVEKILLITDPLLQGEEFKLNRIRIKNSLNSGILHIVNPDISRVQEDDAELAAAVCACFASALNKDVADISYDADFFTDLGGTSLDYFALLSFIKDEFGASLPTDDESGISTVSQFVKFISSHI